MKPLKRRLPMNNDEDMEKDEFTKMIQGSEAFRLKCLSAGADLVIALNVDQPPEEELLDSDLGKGFFIQWEILEPVVEKHWPGLLTYGETQNEFRARTQRALIKEAVTVGGLSGCLVWEFAHQFDHLVSNAIEAGYVLTVH
jgi:hypothetical protein